MVFFGPEEVRAAYDGGVASIHARIKVRMDGKFVETTVGRIIFRDIVPTEIPFESINKPMTKKALGELVDTCFSVAGDKKTVLLADRIKDLGYFYATKAGISIGIEDMKIPKSKAQTIGKAKEDVAQIINQYNEGLITDGERYNKIVDIWTKVTDHIAIDMMDTIKTDIIKLKNGKTVEIPSFNPIFMMADSGARGSAQQIRQLAGIRGLMTKPSGEIIETPIESNFREGLDVLEYFISTHGARKGLADTALKTANSGYLTSRLVDVAHDVIVAEEDCGTLDGIEMEALAEGGEIIQNLGERLLGRVTLDDIRDPYSGRRARTGQHHDHRGAYKTDRRCRHREGRCAFSAVLPVQARYLRKVLWQGPGARQDGEHRRGRGHHRGPVHRRARHPAHHENLPRWWYGHGYGAVQHQVQPCGYCQV